MEQTETIGFFAWWRGQLRELLGIPRSVRRRQLKNGFIVRITGQGYEAARLAGGRQRPLGKFATQLAKRSEVTPAEAAKSGDRIESRLQKRRLPLVLRLMQDSAMVIEETLPAVEERDFYGLVRHRIDLVSPWTHDQVYFDYQLLDYVDPQRVRTRIIVAPRAMVDTEIKRLRQRNIDVDAVDVEETPNWSEPSYDLLQSGVVRRAVSNKILPLIVFGSVFAGILSFNVYYYYGELQQFRERDGFRKALAQRVDDLPEIEQLVEQLRAQSTYVTRQKADQPSATVVIESLSRVMPQETWLETVSYDKGTISFTGYAVDPSIVPALLEASRRFRDIDFQSTGNRISLSLDGINQREFERFSIAAGVVTSWALEP